MGKIEAFTAKEARRRLEDSTFLINSVFKWIDDAAKHCNNSIHMCSDCYDPTMLETVIAMLEEKGFKAKVDEEDRLVTIIW